MQAPKIAAQIDILGAAGTATDMLTPRQMRAARALLGWSRETLAKKSGVPAVTIKGFEALGADSKMSTIQDLRRALSAAGVIFIEADENGGPGVRLKDDKANKVKR